VLSLVLSVDAELLWGRSKFSGMARQLWGSHVGTPVAAQMAGQRIRSSTDIAVRGIFLQLMNCPR
jgi:hypothetical protein